MLRVKFYILENKLNPTTDRKKIVFVLLLGISTMALSQQFVQAEIIKSGDIIDESQFIIGQNAKGNVSVTEDSVLKKENLLVGSRGSGFLIIESGGVVESGIGLLGHNEGGIGTVFVNGPGSMWDNREFIIIGQRGSGNLTIAGGGKVTNTSGVIAQGEGTVGDVEVTGAGSTWENSSNLSIGRLGTGTLIISDGGSVSNAAADVGAETGGDGSVTVTGGTTTWTNNADLSVGNLGTGSLIIEGGGTVTNDIGYVGRFAGASGTVTISGIGSTWNNKDALFIGDAGIGKLVLTGNGRLRVGDGEGRIDIGNVVGSNGTLVVGAQPGSVLTAPGTVEANEIVFGSGTGLIVFNHTSSDYAFSPEIAGDGAVSVLAGTTVLTGTNSYTGGTTITAGTLQIGDGGTSGDLGTGNVENDGTLAFNRSDALTYAGSISGTGSLQQLGNGTTILTGANGYTGGTTITAGTLQIGDGGTSGDLGTGNVENDGTLAFNRSDALTYAGSISGTGSLQQLGSGTTLLSGDSNAFTGNTTINDGTLRVNGTLGGSVMVGSEAVLGGAGTVGETTVLAGGILSPGNSIGTLTIDGDLTLNAGSVYEVEVDPTGTSSDLIVVDGIARLAGSVLHIGEAGNYRPFSEYTILTATGGFDGTTFDGASSDFTFLDALLGYSPNAVTLRLERNDIAFARVAATPNQRAVAGGLDSLSFGNALYDAVVILDGAGARQAFEQLSGEVHASAATALSGSSGNVRTIVSRRFQSAFADRRTATTFPVAAYASYSALAEKDTAPSSSVWGQAFGFWGRIGGDENAAGLRHDQGGFLAGIDTMPADDWRAGMFAGYSRSRFSVSDRASSGSSDNFHLGFHGGTEIGALRLNGGAAHTWHDISTRRTVAFAGFADNLLASYRGRTMQVFGEAGYRFGTDAFSFEPFFGAAHVHTSTSRFTETGGAAALTAQSATTATTFSTLGLRAFSEFSLGAMDVTARGMVGWRHAFGDTTPVTHVSFDGGDAFTVTGTQMDRDVAVIETGLDLHVSDRMQFGLSYEGELGKATSRHGFQARLQATF